MSKCREAFDSSGFANKDPRFLKIWQAAWNARGAVDRTACKDLATTLYQRNPRWQHHTGAATGADACVDAIRKEDEE